MRDFTLVLLILTSTLSFASANHGCTAGGSGQTVGTVTIGEDGSACHYTYFGTGYYSENSWSENATVVSESTTGARVRVFTYENQYESASQSSGSSTSVQDQKGVEVQAAGVTATVGAYDYQETQTNWGCYGGSAAGAYVYSADGETNVYRTLNRGDTRTVPCIPQGLRELL